MLAQDENAPARLRPASTHPSAPPHPQPPLPSLVGGGGRSRLLLLAFLCLAASMAAAWLVEPVVVAAEFRRLPPAAVALTVLLLAASFHVTIHLVHSFVAPCRPPAAAAAAAAAEASATIAVAVGWGSHRAFMVPVELPRSTDRLIAEWGPASGQQKASVAQLGPIILR